MSPTSSFKGQIITQAIGIVLFIILPIVITLMVPFTDLVVRRTGDGATVTVKRYVLIFIPWQTIEISNVKAIRTETTPEFRYRDTADNRRQGRAGTVRLATGQLLIAGDEAEAIVQAAPETVGGISTQFTRFLAGKDPGPVTIPVYASWGLSYLLGGTMTALAALYVLGSCLAIITYPFKRSRRQN